ncbi:MAG: GNAT family N-acetyltransferase [Nitriliruptoraceae bacterium]|nr:GNAT family N-acetyltransferase [Nitriliruptoraceae bacterium]
MDIRIAREVGEDEAIALYDAVGWTAYTRSPDTLTTAIANSTIVVTARDQHGQLVGLARALSDDATILYLQDLLVHPAHQRTGVGRQLLTVCLERYRHVRQKVLLTDDDEAQHRFYEELGYTTTADADAPLHAFVRFDP